LYSFSASVKRNGVIGGFPATVTLDDVDQKNMVLISEWMDNITKVALIVISPIFDVCGLDIGRTGSTMLARDSEDMVNDAARRDTNDHSYIRLTLSAKNTSDDPSGVNRGERLVAVQDVEKDVSNVLSDRLANLKVNDIANGLTISTVGPTVIARGLGNTKAKTVKDTTNDATFSEGADNTTLKFLPTTSWARLRLFVARDLKDLVYNATNSTVSFVQGSVDSLISFGVSAIPARL